MTAANLIAFEKGRAWPRERTRAALEELLQWPAGTIARIRAGAPPPDAPGAVLSDDADTSLVSSALEMALARFDDAIGQLPKPIDIAYASRADADPG